MLLTDMCYTQSPKYLLKVRLLLKVTNVYEIRDHFKITDQFIIVNLCLRNPIPSKSTEYIDLLNEVYMQHIIYMQYILELILKNTSIFLNLHLHNYY